MVRRTTAVQFQKNRRSTRQQPYRYLFNSYSCKQEKRYSPIILNFSALAEQPIPVGTAFAMN
jgi:hypothetical protein